MSISDFFISSAAAADGVAASGQPGLEGLILPVGLIIVFYFLLIRPQQKRTKEHKKLVEAVQKGDEVVTGGGILGKITDLGELFVTVEVAEGVSVKLMRSSISSVMPKGTYKSEGKASTKAKK